ncbi:MAG: hypothetical protein ABEI97_01380 [Candidatus Nanohaloarchaea archaeon]
MTDLSWVREVLDLEQQPDRVDGGAVMDSAELQRRTDGIDRDDAIYFQTSGTISPKRIPFPYDMFPAIKRRMAKTLTIAGLDEEDFFMNLGAPMERNHVSGWAMSVGATGVGATLRNSSFTDFTDLVANGYSDDVTALGSVPSVAWKAGEQLEQETGRKPYEVFPELENGVFGGDHLTGYWRDRLKQQWGLEDARSLYGVTETVVDGAAYEEADRIVPLIDELVFEIADVDLAGSEAGTGGRGVEPDYTSELTDIRDVEETAVGALVLTDPYNEVITRVAVDDLVRVHGDAEIPLLEVLGRTDSTINYGGAQVTERGIDTAMADTYKNLRTWRAAVLQEAVDPRVEFYSVGPDAAVEEEFIDRLKHSSSPFQEAYGEWGIGDIGVYAVDSLADIPYEEARGQDGAKEQRILFDPTPVDG